MEELTKFAELIGVNLTVLISVVPIIVVVVNWAKVHIPLKGRWNLLAGAVLSFIFALFIYQPDLWAIAKNFFVLWLLSVGLWDSAKIVAHKAGNTK